MPVHNEGKWIKQSVEDIIKNTSGFEWELVLVDDFSTDGCLDFVRQGFGRDRIKLIDNTPDRRGAVAARNVAAENASGDVIAFFDAHVKVDSDWLQQLNSSLQKYPNSMITGAEGDFLKPSHNWNVYGVTSVGPGLRWKWIGPEGKDLTKEFEVPQATGSCQIMNKDLFFNKFGAYDEGLRTWSWEDVEFSIRVWQLGYSVMSNPKMHFYHLHADSPNGIRGAHVGWDDYTYNFLRTVYMHFEGPSLEAMKNHYKHDTPEAYEKAMAALRDDYEFHQRIEKFKQARKMTGDEYLEKFHIDVGVHSKSVMAKRTSARGFLR